MDMEINYNQQMLDYYPEVIKGIEDFQAMIKSQSLEVEALHDELIRVLSNSYISSADEATLCKWEQLLEITPLPQGDDSKETWLSDRRDAIIARLYTTEKLNTKSIADVVKIFTGGTTIAYFEDGVIHVLINPPEGSRQYKFENVEQELSKKTPAHLSLHVERNYYTWLQTKDNHTTWNDIKSNFTSWEDVLLKTTYSELSAFSVR